MRKYLFGNVIQSVPVIGTLNAADALGTLAALGFLGFGIQPTEASEWGYDMSRALDDAQAGVWWPTLFPGLAMILLITALTLVGEGLNETLNPLAATAPVPDVTFRQGDAAARRPADDTVELHEPTASRWTRPGARGRDLRVWYGTERGPVKAVDGVSFDARGGARSSAWSASPGAASRRSAADCSACCPTAPSATGSCGSRVATCSP